MPIRTPQQRFESDEDEFGGLGQAMGLNLQADQGQPQQHDLQALQESARSLYDPGFTGIGRYQAANAGQGSAMAMGLVSNAKDKATAATNSLVNAKEKFKQGVNNDQTFSYASGRNPKAGASPYAYAQGSRSPMDGGGVGSPVRAPAYSGPGSLMEAATSLEGDFRDAADYANSLGTEEGVSDALREEAEKSSGYYGTTSNAFDAFLTGSEGHGQLAQAQAEFGGLESLLADANFESIDDVTRRKGREEKRSREEAAARQAQAPQPVQMSGEDVRKVEQQSQLDRVADSLLVDVRDMLINEAGFLGLEGWKGDVNANALEKARRGDMNELLTILHNDYGWDQDKLNSVAAAIRDAGERKKRMDTYWDLVRSGRSAHQRPPDSDLDKVMSAAYEPLMWWLIDEQEKRNG